MTMSGDAMTHAAQRADGIDDAQPGERDGPRAPRQVARSVLARLLGAALWLGVGSAVLLLAMAWFFPQDLRQESRPLMLLNCVAFAGEVLQLHIALAATAALLVALMIRRWRLAAVALLAVLVGGLPTALSWLPKTPPPASGSTLRIHSVNILFANYSPARILPELDRVDAEIIAFQEWHHWHEQHLRPLLAEKYPHSTTFPSAGPSGMAVFSRRPFTVATPDGVDVRVGENGCRLQRVEVEHEGRTLAIYNIHPTSPGRPGALLWGQRQTADLIDLLRVDPLPKIVIGDFNAATGTANLAAIGSIGLVEAHAIAGRGPGWTWPRPPPHGRQDRVLRRLPAIRIDHCFLSPELTATTAEVGQPHGSDHLGLFADVGWRRE